VDTGAWYSPSQLRMLACECGIIPALLASSGEPLDIGRATRTIPTAIRRAVAVRDHGCAYPGVSPAAGVVRCASLQRMATRRRHRPAQLCDALPASPCVSNAIERF
jgi:hypothetical protein